MVPVQGIAANDIIDGWSRDGRSIIVHDRGQLPARVERVDVATGARTLLLTIAPTDAGVQSVTGVCFSSDQGSYAYDFMRYVSRLYQVKGAR